MGCFDSEWAARWLNRKGWLESIAGPTDFGLAVNAVVTYVANPSLGILISGSVGCGKTMLADILYGYLKTPKIRIDCSNNDSVDLLVPECDASMNGGVYSSCADDFMSRHVMIDDIGRESIRNNYSNRLDRVGNFISRYVLRGSGRLIMTTNLNSSELSAHYDDRIVDRIIDKCIVLRLSGKSKRNRNIIA